MTAIRDLAKRRQRDFDAKAPLHPKMPARFISVDGSMDVPNHKMTNWVQTKDGRVHAAFNPGVQVRANMDILLVYDERGRLWIDSPDWDSNWVIELDSPLLGNHGSDHTYVPGEPGPDVVDFYTRALVDCRVFPTPAASMRVRVAAGEYRHLGELIRFSGALSIDFTSQLPGSAGEGKFVVVCIDGDANALAYVYGSVFAHDPLIAPPASARPPVPRNYIVISAIVLYNGQTTITEDDFRNEIRPLLITSTDSLTSIVVFEGAVITHNDEVVWI